jgi:DNA-binding beta-propeller fold protein YncE
MNRIALVLSLSLLASCHGNAEGPAFEISGTLENRKLDEASGLQALADDTFLVHNDEKNELFVIDGSGRHRGSFELDGAKNRDWEALARVPGPHGPLIVVADTGDNEARRGKVHLYFFPLPTADRYEDEHESIHRLEVRYPDGPRDVESVAYDPAGDRILLLSKRDRPPRLYGIPLTTALENKKAEATFLTTVPGFRPPTRRDILVSPTRGRWVSQPTGMDISPDGRMAAVITYRSLYIFHRADGQDWAEAFRSQPVEYLGPPGSYDEAVAFSRDGKTVYVTTERRPAPVYRLTLP